MIKRFVITINGRKRYFDNLESAKQFASTCFAKRNVVLGIEAVPDWKKKCRCGKPALPNDHRCEDCRDEQHTAAEIATGVQ